MSDNEEYEDIKYYNRKSIAHGQSSTSPRYDYSLETNFNGEITIKRLTNIPTYANETVSYKSERKPNKSVKGQSTAEQQAIEIETNDDENTTHTNNIQNNEIPLQCLECIRNQQNNLEQQQQQQQQYATAEYSEPSSPKKKGCCAPIFQHIICRMAILTVFFVILSFLCFINIYLFIFIFVSIVVVIFVNMGANDEQQFEE